MSKKKRKNKRGPTKPKKKIVGAMKGNAVVYEHACPTQASRIKSIETIIGAEFEEDCHDMGRFVQMIESAAPKDHKLRVLMSNEATFLHTGFSTYGREIFKRLHATGKYELAELASYGGPATQEKRASDIPWRYYHVMPVNDVENQEFRSDDRNQFGKWKLTHVLADFKPDIVMCIRDWWMDEHVTQHPLRGKFHMIWMPTVDGYPQKWEWLKNYQSLDTCLAYSHFGKRVLEAQSRNHMAQRRKLEPIDVAYVCQPGVDLEVFKPLPEGESKRMFNIPPHMRFVGSVMRNQPRKLFPRIIESFSMFKRRYPEVADNVYLLLHTSIPDVGWDGGKGIIETIERQGVQEFVFFSYICSKCGHMAIQYFMGSPTACPRCRRNSFVTPSTQVGYTPENFNFVYNLLDVYVQGSIAEGDGMPVNEAKAAGVPVLCSDYSALYEKARNGGGLPIANDTLFNEGGGCPDCDAVRRGGTMQWRSLFDRKDLAKKLADLFGNEQKRKTMGREARRCAEQFYDWALTAKKWEAILDTAPIKNRSETWDQIEPVKVATKDKPPSDMSNEEWLLWCYQNILRRTGVDNDGKKTWIGQLDAGAPRQQLEEHFRSLMKDNEVTAAALADPEKAGMDPIQRIAKEIKDFERGKA